VGIHGFSSDHPEPGNDAQGPAREANLSFTVNRPGGMKSSDFQAYARLLRQRGVDLGKLPRVRDPITDNRWLYVWNTEAEARAFADELKEETGDSAWEVVPVSAQPTEGPLAPLMIQLVRQADGLTFALHPLSRATIRSAFPQAISATTYATIDTPTWHDFRKTKGGLADLVQEIAPALTGLAPDQLRSLGYVVVDADTDETLVSAPSAVAVQA
jgi:hypothetical protein